MNNDTKKIWFLYPVFFLSIQVFSQNYFTVNKKMDSALVDSSGNKGKLSGQFRYFFMATNNQKGFLDYYAHALGIQVKYQTKEWKHLSVAVGGSAVYNLASSDLEQLDPVAKRPDRYEAGLFDLRYPNKKSVYRLEEFYLQHAQPKGWIRLGGQLINTPFINPEDGRMRPTFVNGLYYSFTLGATQLEGGWITGVLPRSISSWQSAGSSIGWNPQGLNTDGTPANYGGHLSSNGIFLAGVTRAVSRDIKVRLWDQYVDNIFNTALIQADLDHPFKEKAAYLLSLQYINQQRVNDGGRTKESKGYFQSAGPAQVLSAMTGVRSSRWDLSLNYTRIFKNARYLMPKEWGREPFFTFMPRERNEGMGDVQAFVAKAAYSFPRAGLKASLQVGIFQLPDVKNAALNKYSMPSYNQVNAEIHYLPPFARGLDLQLLYVYKGALGNTYQNPSIIFNKVNMSLYNVVLNYNWSHG